MRKKIFARFLTVAMVLSLFAAMPLTASAISPDVQFNALEGTVYQNESIWGVSNDPQVPTTFEVNEFTLITGIRNYHWNTSPVDEYKNATFKLVHSDLTEYGPWEVSAGPGSGRDNVYWYAFPNVLIKPGTYTLVDSNNATWSWTRDTDGKGHTFIKGGVAILPNPPVLQSAGTSTDGTKVILTFDKNMADPTGKHELFSVVSGSGNTITAAVLGTGAETIELMLMTPITNSQIVTVSYMPGTVTAEDGGVLAAITEYEVTNNVDAIDNTAPRLTGGSVFRSSPDTAELKFVSNEDGIYYYYVAATEDLPAGVEIVSDGLAGGAVTAGSPISFSPAGLSAGASYVHIVVEDAADNVSAPLMVGMPTDIYYYENFECYSENAYPDHFTINYNGAGNGEQKVISSLQRDDTSGKVFRLKGQSSWSSDQRVLLPLGISGAVTFEVDAKPVANVPGGIALGQNNVQWTGGIVRVQMNQGVFQSIVGDGNVTSSATDYAIDTWYHIKIVLDNTNRVFDYYVNGVKVNNEPLTAHASYILDYLGLYAGNSSGGNEVYYDNVIFFAGGEIASPAMSYPLTPPLAITENGVTATVTFNKESPVEEDTDVTSAVTLTGTSADAGTHRIDLTSVKAGLVSGPQTVTVTTAQDLTTTPMVKNFSFTMPSQAVDDFALIHTFEAADTTSPVLAAGVVSRISDNEATVTFTSDKAGEYYYEVTEAGAGVPVINTSTLGTACDTNEQTISLDSLTAGAKDIYIVVKDANDNVSDALRMEIPAYIPSEPGIIQFEASSHGTYEGYNGWMIGVTRTDGSDGEVSVSYSMVAGTAIAGTHYQAYSGTLTWADGDSSRKVIMFTAYDDSIYNGYLDLSCVLSNPTGGAVLGGQNPLNIQISDNDPPPVPTGLRAVAGNGQVSLSWDSVNSAYYKLYYSTVNGDFTEANSVTVYEGENYTLTGLKNGTAYYFAIKAGHDIYFSDLSGTVSATPKASSSGGGSSTPPQYPVTDANQGTQPDGQTRLSQERAEAGDTVIITVTPDIGYESVKPVVLDSNKKPIAITDNGDGTFSFKMPAGGVAVETEFAKIDYFDDVTEGDWFDEASWYCAAHGLMQGTEHRQFDGHIGTNRAMLVTVLYNLANSTDSFDSIFDDVASGNWYSNAIAWAAHHKIIAGYGNGKFGPHDPLTREQLVSVLYNYAIFMNYDTSKLSELDAFTDADAVSDWAVEAIRWAVGNGIVAGMGNDLIAPETGATRAQFAAMMQRYVTTYEK